VEMSTQNTVTGKERTRFKNEEPDNKDSFKTSDTSVIILPFKLKDWLGEVVLLKSDNQNEIAFYFFIDC
jgi:hypothetical protein